MDKGYSIIKMEDIMMAIGKITWWMGTENCTMIMEK